MSDVDEQFQELTIERFHAGLTAGRLTAVTLVEWYLARIARHDRQGAGIGAIVTVNPTAREEAAERDASFARDGALTGPLHGVPVLVKDQAETAGLRTTFGSVVFADYVPEADATLIARLKDAGAVILAKTAMCDFAAGWFSSSSMTGRTRNPYDLVRDSGGSSAGTGAGVAADFGLVGIGEDTGGSIRIPASFNNLFGLRVTTGLISRAGFSPLVHFQDTPGPMARTVSDLALVLDGVAGYDAKDALTANAWRPRRRSYRSAVGDDVPAGRWRVGVLESGFGSDDDPDAAPVNRVVRAAIARLEALGVAVVHGIQIEALRVWIADTSVYAWQSKPDITAFLQGRPGAPASSFMEVYDSGRFHPLNDLFHAIAAGPTVASGADDVEVLRRRRRQEAFQALVLGLFASHEIDLLVFPTVQVVPPTFEELEARKYQALTFPTNTVIGSQAGLPALTMPVGFTAETGLPVGLEVLGVPLGEVALLQFGRVWERAAAPRRAPAL
jgi:amidase